MMHRLSVLICLFLSGCILYSENPLSNPLKTAIDEEIIGTWYWVDDNEKGFVHVGKNNDSTRLLLTMVDQKADGRIETTEFDGITSEIKGNKILNLRWLEPDKIQLGYFFMKYEIKGDSATGTHVDFDYFENAIKAKRLSGEIKSTGTIHEMFINESQDKLRIFFEENMQHLFKDSFELKRLRLSNPAAKEPKIGSQYRSDFSDLLAMRPEHKTEEGRAMLAPAQRIIDNGYNMALSSLGLIEAETVEHAEPEKILSSVAAKEERILGLIAEMQELLAGGNGA